MASDYTPSRVPRPARLDAYRWVTPLAKPKQIHLDQARTIDVARTTAPHIFADAVGVLPEISGPAWGYGAAGDVTSPGPTLIATAGQTAKVSWRNRLLSDQDREYPFHMPTRDMAAAQMMDRYQGGTSVVHLHGGHLPWTSDGFPMRLPKTDTAGFANPTGHIAVTRPGETQKCVYPNTQKGGATMWYHDHTMDRTARNVYAGLAGMYWLRHAQEGDFPVLPSGDLEIPLILQDRSFVYDDKTDKIMPYYGDARFADAYLNATQNGENGKEPLKSRAKIRSWRKSHSPMAEFKGTTLVVNGTIWPRLDVKPRAYRFRIVNGANTRFFNLRVSPSEQSGTPGLNGAALPIIQIGTDGGFLTRAVTLSGMARSPHALLILAPGERADVIIDFSGAAGQTLYLTNHASDSSPFGIGGDDAQAQWADGGSIRLADVMQFNVSSSDPAPPLDMIALNAALAVLGTVIEAVPAVAKVRTLILREFGDIFLTKKANAAKKGPVEPSWAAIPFQRNLVTPGMPGKLWSGPPPVHERRRKNDYGPPPMGGPLVEADDFYPLGGAAEIWEIYNISADIHPIHIHHTQFQIIDRQKIRDKGDLTNLGPVHLPAPNEKGWKDTVRANLDERVRLLVKFDDGGDTRIGSDGKPLFDYTGNYVLHCHLLEHEDMGMMRPVRID